MALIPSAVVEQSTGKVFSYISTKLDEKASRAVIIARIETVVRRLDIILENTGKIAITSVPLLRTWNVLKRVYMEGIELLNKYKPQRELDVRSYSYLHRIVKTAANLSISSLVGWVNEHLSSSHAQYFEIYADCAEKFVADVDSCCPLRRDKFRYPFLRYLFEGKTLWFERKKGKQHSVFGIWPVILEGRGVEALLYYLYFDPNRLEKTFYMWLALRISESTDIIGTAINCLRSSASLLNPVAQEAVGELTLLHNFQDISNGPLLNEFLEWYPESTKIFRSDPLCCQAGNGHEPSINSRISSELSQIFPEQIILFAFQCYIPMVECRLAGASDKAHGNAMVDRHGGPQPLFITYFFAPHLLSLFPCMLEANSTIQMTICKKEGLAEDIVPGNNKNIQENFDGARPALIDFLTDEPEATECAVVWSTKHGAVSLYLKKPLEDIVTAPKARGRYETRSAKKRKM